MHYVPGITVRDLPAPPTVDQVVQRLAWPVFAFVAQPHLEEGSYGTKGVNDQLMEASLTYSVYRHPDDLENPSNFAEDIASTQSAIAKAVSDKQPEWFMESLRRRRYPMLWEAVSTTRLGLDADRSLAERLAERVNHVLINTVESRRRSSEGAPPTLDHEVAAGDAQSGFTLNIDGTDIEALLLDSDPDVIGWAAEVDDCAVLIAFSRDFAGMIDLRLERRQVA